MSDLTHAKVDDTDNGDRLIGALDDAQDELTSEIRKGHTYRSAGPNAVYSARTDILDRINSLCEALSEARSALSTAEERVEELETQLEQVNAEKADA